MNITESTGESSSNGREDGDAASGFERPHKKARYAWQVKGKYHLKNESRESNNATRAAPDPAASNDLSPSSTISNNRIELDDYFSKKDLGSVIDRNTSLLAPSSVVSEQPSYPRYISSNERKSESNYSFQNESVSIRGYDLEDEDICIRQWQAQQMLKIFLDNTLNRAMESWTRAVPEDDENAGHLAFDFAQFFNNFPGDNSVENEGIMMAISAHGLQNTSANDSNDASSVDNSGLSSASLRSFSPTLSHEDTIDQQDTIEPVQYDNFSPRNVVPSEYYSDSYDFFSNNDQNLNMGIEDDNVDFMNAAIMHAIKTNGLTIPGTEYG